MIGPNALPIQEVPWGWMANSATSRAKESNRDDRGAMLSLYAKQ